jgi:hypothetical protein
MSRYPKGFCQICKRADIENINTVLKSGGNAKDLANQIGVTPSLLYKHRHHIDGKPSEDKSSIERCDEMERTARLLLEKAVKSGDARSAVALIRAANESLALSSKLRGEMTGIQPHETGITYVNFNTFTDRILAGLDNAPEAKKIILKALSQMEDDNEKDTNGISGLPVMG